ncbi:MAG TPA: hypothetical protein VF691_09075, partial [Cytophagaceae bacterium]
MNKQAFLDLIKHPSTISSEALKGLEEVVVNFPYCQSAHILIAKGFHEQGSMLTIKKISKAAVYSLDRKNLKKFIHAMPFMPKAGDFQEPRLEEEKKEVSNSLVAAPVEIIDKAPAKLDETPPLIEEEVITTGQLKDEGILPDSDLDKPKNLAFDDHLGIEKPETSNIRRWIEAQKRSERSEKPSSVPSPEPISQDGAKEEDPNVSDLSAEPLKIDKIENSTAEFRQEQFPELVSPTEELIPKEEIPVASDLSFDTWIEEEDKVEE